MMKQFTLTLSAIATLMMATQLEAGSSNEKICFENVTATPHETVKSEPVEISGLEAPTKIKLLGRGKYLLNGVEIEDKESYVSNGDKVQVVLEADKTENANIRTTLVMDGTYDVFTVTTKQGTIPHEEDVSLKCISKNLGS
jgi:hypothetical protein